MRFVMIDTLTAAEATARGFISIADAIEKGYTKKHRSTLTREGNSGAIPACWVEKGSRPVMWVLKDALDKKLIGQTVNAVEQLEKQWLSAMRNGTFGNKPYSEDTVTMRERCLGQFWQMLGKPKSLNEMTVENLTLVLGQIKHDVENRNDHFGLKMQIYSAVIGFMKYLVQKNLKTDQDRKKMVAFRPKERYKIKKQTLEHHEALEIIKANQEWRTSRTEHNVRVMDLLLHLFTYAGIRRSEAINLKRENILWEKRMIQVFGKNSKERFVSPHPLVWPVLKNWVDDYCSDAPTGILVVDFRGRKYSRRLINKKFEGLSKRMKKHIHPHMFRGAFALLMANAGMPLNNLQYNMGHDDIDTTMGYFTTEYKHVRDWVAQNLEQTIGAPVEAPNKTDDDLLAELLEA